MYSLLQKLKVKEADVWNCFDSLCDWKEMNSFLLFDQQNRVHRRIRADLVTDRIVGEAYQSLDVAERGELVRLFDEAVKHLRAAAVP